MRTRLIRPEFWADSRMADLPGETRLTYIGLWCLADDDGYLRWSIRDIAAELYRYEPPRKREARVEKQLAALVDAERVEPLACGVHALIRSLLKYRIQGGNHSKQHHESHTGTCPVPIRKDQSRSVTVSDSVTDTGSEPSANGSKDPDRRGVPLAAINPAFEKWARKH